MKLLEIQTNDKNLVEFIQRKYITNFFLLFNPKKCYEINKLLIELGIEINKLISCITNNIDYERFNNVFYLVISEEIKIKDIKIVTLCKLIENGTMNIKPYPIFTETKNYTQKYMNIYLQEYKMIKGGL